uniref:SFRICE_004732 n=1 Tax=Spodoptera frugiperda TaxID=7108 RepID=A0A2H1WJG4_SPOFR
MECQCLEWSIYRLEQNHNLRLVHSGRVVSSQVEAAVCDQYNKNILMANLRNEHARTVD